MRVGVLPELCSAGSWDAPRDQSWGLDWHRNEGVEFTFLFSGRLAFAVDGASYRLRPNYLTITWPWQRHRVGQPGIDASHLAWLILDVGVRRPNQAWNWPKWLVLTLSEREHLTALLRQRSRFTTCCRQLTNRTPAEFLAYCRVTEASRQSKMSIADIACACGFSSGQHFATTFRALNGVTPTQWRSTALSARNVRDALSPK